MNLISTLSALPALQNSHAYTGVPTSDPISVIRVNVAGATGPDALSRARMNAVAQQIEQRTGLDVDIVAGSSPPPVTIDVSAGKVQVRGVDYIAAGATVALGVLAVADVVFLNIAERAAELATMRSFGWHDAILARLVITEGALIGVTGSLAGAGLGLGAAGNGTITIEAGAFAALTGASGSGKSTLLHMIGAIERLDSGVIISNGTEVTSLRGTAVADYRRTVGFVFQRYNLLPGLTARDNIIAPVLPYRTRRDKRVRARDLLAAVGLAGRERSLPGRMSGGEQTHRHRPRPDQHPRPAARRRTQPATWIPPPPPRSSTSSPGCAPNTP